MTGRPSTKSISKFAPSAVLGLLPFAVAGYGQVSTGQASQSPHAGSSAPASTAASPKVAPDQIPSKAQLAKLFEVMRLRDQMQGVMGMIPAMVKQQVQSQMTDIMARLAPGAQLNDEQHAQLADLITKYVRKATNVYTIDDLISDMTTVYQHHVSRSDVNAMIAFYSSPAGQHLLNAQPAIMKEYMPIVMERQRHATDELTDEMQKDLEAFTKSLAGASGPSSPNAPADH